MYWAPASVSGVWSVMPSEAVERSSSARSTRSIVSSGATGGVVVVDDSCGSEVSDCASASSTCASASSCSASTSPSYASTTDSALDSAASRGSTRSSPAVFTSPTVGAVSSITSP